MALVLRRSQLGAKALQASLGRELVWAAEELGDPSRAPERRVHQVRRQIKRLRALLRLLRAPLGDNAWQDLNRRLREVARTLALSRETDVHPVSLARLLEGEGNAQARQVSAALRAHCAVLRAKDPSAEQLLERAAAGLRAVAAALPAPDCWGAVGEKRLLGSFADAYLKACAALRRAQRTGSAAAFHFWRRRVKDHQYHLVMLRRLLPDSAAQRRRDVEALSELLGQANDYYELDEVLAQLDPAVAGPALDAVRARLLSALATARHKALTAGQKLFDPARGATAAAAGTRWGG